MSAARNDDQPPEDPLKEARERELLALLQDTETTDRWNLFKETAPVVLFALMSATPSVQVQRLKELRDSFNPPSRRRRGRPSQSPSGETWLETIVQLEGLVAKLEPNRRRLTIRDRVELLLMGELIVHKNLPRLTRTPKNRVPGILNKISKARKKGGHPKDNES
jgi:hypothetical protein